MTPTQIDAAKVAGTALYNALQSRGISTDKLGLLMTQIAHETGGFASRVFFEDNNLSGIKFVNQQGASKGVKSPEGNYYAAYPDTNTWANDYLRILSKGSNPPINASNLTDFANRLKANGYFTDTTDNYLHGLKAWAATYKKYLPNLIVQNGSSIAIVAAVLLAVIIFIYK